MNPKIMYEQKLVAPEDATKIVKPGMTLWIGDFTCVAWLFDKALAKRTSELENVNLWVDIPYGPVKCIETDKNGEVFSVSATYFTEFLRGRPNVHVFPLNLGDVAHLLRNGEIKVDVAVKTVTPMDKNGFFNFSTVNTYSKAMFDTAKIKIVEVNESFPWALGGYDECIHVSEVDYIIENNEDEIATVQPKAPSEVEKKIAENIISILPKSLDGLTLQIGIGGVPDAICKLLEEEGAKDLGIHTELLTDGIFRLTEAGIVTGKKKSFLPGKIVHTLAIGSKEMYEWMNYNPSVASFPADFVNDPFIIALNKNLVSINAALEIDLTGQVNAESIGHIQYTGTGGQFAWTYAVSYRSPKALPPIGSPSNISIIALPSAYFDRKTGKLASRIVPLLKMGSAVTTPRNNIMYIVTEYGVAKLRGKNVKERALELIRIAHPDFRDQLIEDAKNLGFI
ncbi:MAG: acetyl-CoA hydrolase/transferase C-terminal domain-containing protein [Candidatus Bathyarchaeia archaeon]